MKHQVGFIGGLIILAIVNIVFAQSERDIVLTPNSALQIRGKTLYYQPIGNLSEHNGNKSVPWEQTLKHVTYLTINNHIAEKAANLSGISDYKRFLKSSYIRSSEYIPKFGDIITVAQGRLEKLPNNEYKFIEGQCLKKCIDDQQNYVASWIVQKIRHRDASRKFRYEIKFSVSPNVSDKSDSKREIGKRKVRSFIQKDDDYPKHFQYLDHHIEERQFDEQPKYVDRTERYNKILPQPKSFRNGKALSSRRYDNYVPDLNIGEYFPSVHVSSRIGIQPNRIIFPTTYRPSYHVKFSKPDFANSDLKYPQYNFNSFEEKPPQPVATTHLHHHYYVTESSLPDNSNSQEIQPYQNFKDHRSALNIIEQPVANSETPKLTHQHYNTPAPISNQIPVPPNLQIAHPAYSLPLTNPIIQAPPLIYMQPLSVSHQIPLYIYPKNTPVQNEYVYTTRPFKESAQDESVRYSEPDPLYHSVSYDSESSFPGLEEPDRTEISVPFQIQIENNTNDGESAEKESPDSINAQLPAPERDQDLFIPYVDTSIETQTSASISRFTVSNSDSIPRSSSVEHGVIATIEKVNQDKVDRSSENITDSIELLANKSAAKISKDVSTMIPKIVSNSAEDAVQENPPTKHTTTNYHTTINSTTERSIPKRKLKRTKLSKLSSALTSERKQSNTTKLNHFKNSKFEFQAIPVNVTQKIITVTPANVAEVQTKQSVSTSISIKVGTDEEHPFMPTITVPNVELYKANLEHFGTNSSNIKVYMASDLRKPHKDGKKKIRDKKEEIEIAKTIVQHVQSLS